MNTNRKYGKVPTKKEEIERLANAIGVTPRDIANAVYGIKHTRGEYDYVIQVLREKGLGISQAYVETLWND